MGRLIQVLILEDSDPDAELLQTEIEKLGLSVEWKRADSEQTFRRMLRQDNPDLILADYSHPGFSGESALAIARETLPNVPFLIVTNAGDEAAAVDMLKKGATDYVFKDHLGRLGPAVERALREAWERKAREGAEEAYRESMERYRRVVEDATEMILTTDERGVITYANRAALTFLGYTMGDLWNMTYLDLARPEYRNRARIHYLRQYLSGEYSSLFEVPVRTKGGTVHWLSQNVSKVTQEGKLQGFQVISRDVTERKKLEEAYLLAVDQSLQGFVIFQEGRIVFVNKTYAQSTGYTREEILALSPEEVIGLIHPDDRELVAGRIQKRLSGIKDDPEYEFRVIHKDGSIRWLQIHAVLTEYLGKPAIQASLIDLTPKKKIEEDLGKAEDRFSKIFHANPVSIAVSTLPDGTILDVNSSFERMSGYTRKEIVGKTVAELNFWVDPEHRQRLIEALRTHHRLQGVEARFRAKSGEIRDGFLSFEVVDIGGRPVLLSMAVDITEKKKAEEELRQNQERLQAVVNGAPIVLWAVDEKGRFTLSEGKGLLKLGFQPGELVGKNISEVFGSQIPDLSSLFEEALHGKETTRQVSVGPVVVDARYSPLRTARGDIAGIIGVATDVTEQKRMEQELRENEMRLRLLVEGVKDYAIYMLEPKGHIISWNEGAERIKGYREDEALGRHISIFHSKDEERRKAVDTILAGAVESGQAIDEGWRVRKDGSLFWASSLITPLHNDDGSLRGFAVITRDETDRRRSENALRESEERFRLAFEDAPNGMVITALNGKFLKVNQRMCSMVGYSEEELLEKDFASITYDEDRSESLQGAKDLISGRKKQFLQEKRYVTKQGSIIWIWLTSSLERDSEGNPLYFISHLQDITDRKKAQEALQISEIRFSTLFRSSPAAIAMGIIGEDRFLDVNERYCEFFGYSREELLSRSATDLRLWANEEDRLQMVNLLEKRQVIRNVEAKLRHKSGNIRDGLLSMEVVEILGEPTLIAMLVDITGLKAAEERLRSSTERLRALSARLQSVREDEQTRIAREIHDELGQSLTALKMDLVWLEKRVADRKEKAKELPAKIRSMFSLIDDTIRTVRRISAELRPGALDDLGLVAALEWQLNEFARRTTIKCRFSSSQEQIPIDRERSTAIFRIFQEALTNVARHSSATRLTARLEKKNYILTLEIKDNGRGITQEEIEKKTSLGLLGMRERALIFDGTVEISGTRGKGTMLKVSIPLEEKRKTISRKKKR